MTEYTFFTYGFKVVVRHLLNGWAYYIYQGAACINAAGGHADRTFAEQSARIIAENRYNEAQSLKAKREANKEVTHA